MTMTKSHDSTSRSRKRETVPLGLLLFCITLMGPAFAINAAFIAIAVPAMAPFGIRGLVFAGVVGSVFGYFPALWLARRIHEGLRDQ
jgi:hypothetical protein